MDVYRSLGEVPRAEGRSIALGTFDGVHRGHREVIAGAVARARERGSRAMVVTFDPHPLQVLRPDEAPELLTSLATKAELVAALGVDELLAIPFTVELSRRTADWFCEEVLVGALGAGVVGVGANFRFGHRAEGDADLLRGRSEFETAVVPLVEYRGAPISSSRIRDLVGAGEVAAAADLLGAPYRIDGEVVSGAARGRALDMRTANVDPSPGLLVPGAGIYAGTARPEGADEVAAAISVGVRPTFERDGDLRVEAHLIGWDGDLYGKRLQVTFLEKLRDEVRFDSAEALVQQMNADVAQVREIVSRS